MTKTASEGQDGEPTPIPPGRLAELFAFIKLARATDGDWASLAAPAFILSPISLVEFPSFWCQDSSLFVAPTKQASKILRSLEVLKWYLRTLRPQWSRGKGLKKKPLNPILGELFLGHWEEEEAGRTELVAEQVSHHPPVTAYRTRNEKHKITMEGYHRQWTHFRGRPCIDRIGQVMLHLNKFEEDYLIEYVNMHLEGLMPPRPYPELEGKTHIVGSNGMTAEIEYKSRGWLRGKKNSFHAKLYQEGHSDAPLFFVEGQWNGGAFTVYDSVRRPLETIDTEKPISLPAPVVKPLEEQDPLESRRVWHKVASAIEKGELATVNRDKHKLEEEQRALRKKEKAEGIEWQPRYFRTGKWDEAEQLLAKIDKTIRKEETKGIWRWIGQE